MKNSNRRFLLILLCVGLLISSTYLVAAPTSPALEEEETEATEETEGEEEQGYIYVGNGDIYHPSQGTWVEGEFFPNEGETPVGNVKDLYHQAQQEIYHANSAMWNATKNPLDAWRRWELQQSMKDLNKKYEKLQQELEDKDLSKLEMLKARSELAGSVDLEAAGKEDKETKLDPYKETLPDEFYDDGAQGESAEANPGDVEVAQVTVEGESQVALITSENGKDTILFNRNKQVVRLQIPGGATPSSLGPVPSPQDGSPKEEEATEGEAESQPQVVINNSPAMVSPNASTRRSKLNNNFFSDKPKDKTETSTNKAKALKKLIGYLAGKGGMVRLSPTSSGEVQPIIEKLPPVSSSKAKKIVQRALRGLSSTKDGEVLRSGLRPVRFDSFDGLMRFFDKNAGLEYQGDIYAVPLVWKWALPLFLVAFLAILIWQKVMHRFASAIVEQEFVEAEDEDTQTATTFSGAWPEVPPHWTGDFALQPIHRNIQPTFNPNQKCIFFDIDSNAWVLTQTDSRGVPGQPIGEVQANTVVFGEALGGGDPAQRYRLTQEGGWIPTDKEEQYIVRFFRQSA